jgi:Trypsin-like peptidase domain/TPR repeat
MRFIITASMGKPGESMKLLCALVLVIASATAEAAETSAGSGVVIGTQGEILTNSHVVEDCQKITVQFPSKDSETAVLVARDQRNDLAVVRTGKLLTSIAAFRDGAPVRAGDAVVALGYPLSGLLASTANLSVGNVSALAGLGDDSRYLQISAPVQPGNSGGPLVDASGHLVGIVTSKLNALRMAKFTGDIPQNVNFALKAEVARTFLDSKGIAYQKASSDQQLSPADVGDIARPFTVHIECRQTASRSVATLPAPQRSSPPDQKPDDKAQAMIACSKPLVDEAIAACTRIIRARSSEGVNLAAAYNNRGNAYGRKSDYDRAIADYSEAIQLDPKKAEIFNNRGFTYFDKQDFPAAAAD